MKNVIIAGASGMIGKLILENCLKNSKLTGSLQLQENLQEFLTPD